MNNHTNTNMFTYIYYRWTKTYGFEYQVLTALNRESRCVVYTVPGKSFVLILDRWAQTKENLLKRGFKRLNANNL